MIQFLEDIRGNGTKALDQKEQEELETLRILHPKLFTKTRKQDTHINEEEKVAASDEDVWDYF